MDCYLNNNAKGNGCAQYEGIISGMLIKSVPFSYTPSELIDVDFIKSELVATDDRLFILVDKDDHENIQQREAQNGTTASGRQQYYGQTAHAFSLKERKPRPYDIRKAFLDGGGSQKVYAMPFTTQGFVNPNLIDGAEVAKEYDMTKVLMEAVDYTTGEKMIQYIFTEYSPEQNTEYHESIKPTAYDPNLLDGVNDVELSIVSANATTIVCTVNLAGESANNISALLTANFSKLDTSGVTEAVTAAYDSGTGQYTLTGVGLTTGTLQVVPVVTDSVYYESTPATVTIP